MTKPAKRQPVTEQSREIVQNRSGRGILQQQKLKEGYSHGTL